MNILDTKLQYDLRNKSDTATCVFTKAEVVRVKKEYNILHKSLVDLTKLHTIHYDISKYDRETLLHVLTLYNDIIEHTNEFMIEVIENGFKQISK